MRTLSTRNCDSGSQGFKTFCVRMWCACTLYETQRNACLRGGNGFILLYGTCRHVGRSTLVHTCTWAFDANLDDRNVIEPISA